MVSKKLTSTALIIFCFSLFNGAFVNGAEAARNKKGKYGYVRCLYKKISDKKRLQIQKEILGAENAAVMTQAVINVPVYVHVIQNSNGDNNVTQSQINSQIAFLNSAFKGKVKFTLQNTDLTVNDDWFGISYSSNAQTDMKQSLYTGDSTTLNIYLTDLRGGLLGYATFPWEYRSNPSDDGIVIQYTTLPGGSAFPYNRGDTVVHEVGHWLGLFHTFQDTNVSNNGCKGSGDSVSDTPAEKIPQYSCVTRDSCPTLSGKDPIKNYMDYSPDACLNMFTSGQFKRIAAMFATYR